MAVSADVVTVLQKHYGDQIEGSFTEAGARQALEGRQVPLESDRLALAEFLQKLCAPQIKDRVLAAAFPDRRNVRPR